MMTKRAKWEIAIILGALLANFIASCQHGEKTANNKIQNTSLQSSLDSSHNKKPTALKKQDTGFNQRDAKGRKQGFWKTYYPDGHLNTFDVYLNDSINGFWKHYYQTGQLRAIGYERRGVHEGESFLYYLNGKVQFYFNFLHGKWIDQKRFDALGKLHYHEICDSSGKLIYETIGDSGHWDTAYGQGVKRMTPSKR